MGILFDILAFPLMGPIKGVNWIAGKIVEQVDKEFYSEDAVRAKLLELELRFDLGEINEKDYLELEETFLKMLRVARDRKTAESTE